MPNALYRKLCSFVDLSREDDRAIENLCSKIASFKAGDDLIQQGDRPEHAILVLEGWAFCYKIEPGGSRQILGYLIPGDFCDIQIFLMNAMDYSIGALSDVKVALLPQQAILTIMENRPLIARALWWATLVDAAVLREWLVNIGKRSAYKRIAHLFCEMWVRMQQVGLVSENKFFLPLTQIELADTLGLTPVHVNRSLQRMRTEKLIQLEHKQLTIHNQERMAELCDFSPSYLHLERRK